MLTWQSGGVERTVHTHRSLVYIGLVTTIVTQEPAENMEAKLNYITNTNNPFDQDVSSYEL